MSSLPPKDIQRQIVPRWRPFSAALTSGELGPMAVRAGGPSAIDPDYAETLGKWEAEHTLEHAVELLEGAIVRGRTEDAKKAAAFILSPAEQPSAETVAMARTALSDGVIAIGRDIGRASLKDHRGRIRSIRACLVRYPRNPIAWVELSREYASVGQQQQATRAMEIAISMARDNRHVLRSATRLFVHIEEPDRALYHLDRSGVAATDPWLLAAHIAASRVAEQPRKLLNRARPIVANAETPNFQLSELRSALATEFLFDGSARDSRKMFKESLTSPTENAVAQAVWASRLLDGFKVEEGLPARLHSSEAIALTAFRAREWTQVMANCDRWLAEEPFASRPPILGSFVGTTVGCDPGGAESLARAGLIPNPFDSTLRNNLAVALAQQGRSEEARTELAKVPRPVSEESVECALIATEGLIAFRAGDPVQGRSRYLEAIAFAAEHKFRLSEALATMMLAFEELRAGVATAPEAIARAVAAAPLLKGDPAMEAFLQLLLDELEKVRAAARG